VLTKSNGYVAGSARSVVGYDLYEALCGCSDLLEQFGGHKYAAGLTMLPENVPAFIKKFEEVVSATITDSLLTQEIVIEDEINLLDIDAKFFRILKQFEPFGPQNMSPIFLSKQVSSYGYGTIVGNNHLKMVIKQPHSPIFNCIGFGLGDYLEDINKGKLFDICYTIEENNYKDKKSLQLNIKGIKSY
jgi:single-stranded-DNA-specific exonuclease